MISYSARSVPKFCLSFEKVQGWAKLLSASGATGMPPVGVTLGRGAVSR